MQPAAGFYIDPDLRFDIKKLRAALDEVDARVGRESPLGGNDMQAICLTQITGDANSISGDNVRGLYWTKPDETYAEVQREEPIAEEKYDQFVNVFSDTYFNEIYTRLTQKYRLGRVRLLWKLPRTTLSWHRDPEPRLHIPIITNFGARMCIEDVVLHMPADGRVWITDNTKYHNAFNGGEVARVHLVATVLNFDRDKFEI